VDQGGERTMPPDATEPKTVSEAIEQAREARLDAWDRSAKNFPNNLAGADEARRQETLEQIADALIGIQWALRSKSGNKGSTKSAARKKEEAEAFIKNALVVGTQEEYEQHIRQHPEDRQRNVIFTGVPRAPDSYVRRNSATPSKDE
jgi:alkanesulfonate monooxygenase SsuD/methylene tetrahydromethanopterin reductase-like flavin-dependent oxidoreductase (luciferase family)